MTGNNIRAIIASVLISLSLHLGAQVEVISTAMPDPEGFKKEMTDANAWIRTIQSEFLQVKHLSFLEEEVKSSGRFIFEKENRLRWEYGSPFFYLIIFKNDSILIQDQKDTRTYDMNSSRMFIEINNIMMGLVNGDILQSDDFSVEYLEQQDIYILELTPLNTDMKEFLSKIRLHLSRKNYTADEIFMIEPSGDYTHIRFFQKKLNEDIPPHSFDLP